MMISFVLSHCGRALLVEHAFISFTLVHSVGIDCAVVAGLPRVCSVALLNHAHDSIATISICTVLYNDQNIQDSLSSIAVYSAREKAAPLTDRAHERSSCLLVLLGEYAVSRHIFLQFRVLRNNNLPCDRKNFILNEDL